MRRFLLHRSDYNPHARLSPRVTDCKLRASSSRERSPRVTKGQSLSKSRCRKFIYAEPLRVYSKDAVRLSSMRFTCPWKSRRRRERCGRRFTPAIAADRIDGDLGGSFRVRVSDRKQPWPHSVFREITRFVPIQDIHETTEFSVTIFASRFIKRYNLRHLLSLVPLPRRRLSYARIKIHLSLRYVRGSAVAISRTFQPARVKRTLSLSARTCDTRCVQAAGSSAE